MYLLSFLLLYCGLLIVEVEWAIEQDHIKDIGKLYFYLWLLHLWCFFSSFPLWKGAASFFLSVFFRLFHCPTTTTSVWQRKFSFWPPSNKVAAEITWIFLLCRFSFTTKEWTPRYEFSIEGKHKNLFDWESKCFVNETESFDFCIFGIGNKLKSWNLLQFNRLQRWNF